MRLYQHAAAALMVIFTLASSSTKAQEIDVWLGTGGSPSHGIYHCTLNSQTGRLSPTRLVAEVSGPGFLAMHPDRSHLYAVGSLDGKPSVIAYRISGEADQAALELVGSAEIGDGGAAHVAVDQLGKMLLTAQYGGGSVAAFSLAEDGTIGKRTALIKHAGASGVVGNRQDSSHAHWVGFSPDQQFAFVPDLGLDKVVIYKVDVDHATLELHGFGVLPAGAGPRHMKFHPNGKWIFVLNELDLSVSVFDYDRQAGTMTIKQTIPTVSKAELAKEKFASCSEIRVHPNGNFVYAANRGHDTLTAFSVAPDGRLAEIQNENVRGATPRNFNLDPSGRWLLVGGQDSHTLGSFEVDAATGQIIYNQSIVSTPTPICVLFQPGP